MVPSIMRMSLPPSFAWVTVTVGMVFTPIKFAATRSQERLSARCPLLLDAPDVAGDAAGGGDVELQDVVGGAGHAAVLDVVSADSGGGQGGCAEHSGAAAAVL